MGRIYNPDEAIDGSAFRGRVESADWEEGQYGDQLKVGIKSLDFEVKGPTGLMWEWYSYSDKKNSKWMIFLTHLKELGITLKGDDDVKKLLGKIFTWERKTIDYGMKDGKKIESKDTLFPMAGEDGKKVAGSHDSKSSAATPAKSSADFTELHSLLKADGLTSGQISKWADRKGVLKAEVGKHMQDLETAGKLTKDGEGLYTLKE